MKETSTQWWNAPAGRPRFIAYYRMLRTAHQATASDALHQARSLWKSYPEFAADPVGVLRKAIGRQQ